MQTESVSSRMSFALKEATDYYSYNEEERIATEKLWGSSVGTRLEMWRSVQYFLQDTPVFGVGNGNYNKAMTQYVEQGKLNETVNRHGHPHNVFVNAIITKGLLGLFATCLVFFFPLFVYIKTFALSRYSALTGITLVLCFFLISMNETAPFYKSNFVATFLILGLVIFQYHMTAIKNKSYG